MFTRKFYLQLIITFIFTQLLIAQIHVDNNGNVGIGTESPSSLLDIESNNSSTGIYVDLEFPSNLWTGYGIRNEVNSSSTARPWNNYGIYTKATGGSYSYGISSHANSSYKSIAVHGSATGSATYKYGIYGYAPTATNSWAGYFSGRTYCSSGTWYSSDERLKDDIKDIKDAIIAIQKMKPKKYKFKKNEIMNLPDEEQFGLTAQELEQIYPQLVTEATSFEQIDVDSKKGQELKKLTFKAVNYNGLIPILIKGLQEQQEMIEDLQKNQEEMLKRIEQLEKKK